MPYDINTEGTLFSGFLFEVKFLPYIKEVITILKAEILF